MCEEHDVPVLLFGHHADDQVETFLQRLYKSSGLSGLAGIATNRPLDAARRVTLVRPLLSVPKARLLAACEQGGLPWVEDPSNTDTRFDRARIREARRLMAQRGAPLSTEARQLRRPHRH